MSFLIIELNKIADCLFKDCKSLLLHWRLQY